MSDKGRCGGSGRVFETKTGRGLWTGPCPGCEDCVHGPAPCSGCGRNTEDLVKVANAILCPDCQPDNLQGIEEKWLLCPDCWSVFGPDTNEACECERNPWSRSDDTKPVPPRIEVVPLSRLREVEKQRDDEAGWAEHYERERGREAARADDAESQRDKLREAIERVVAASGDHASTVTLRPSDISALYEAVSSIQQEEEN